MTLGQFKDKIEELEKAGLINDNFLIEINADYEEWHYRSITNIKVEDCSIVIKLY